MSEAECREIRAELAALRSRVERLTWAVIALIALAGGDAGRALFAGLVQ